MLELLYGIVNNGQANSTVESTKRKFSQFHWSLKSSFYCARSHTYDSCLVEHTEIECVLLNKNCTCDCCTFHLEPFKTLLRTE